MAALVRDLDEFNYPYSLLTAQEAADIVEAEGLSQIGDENELQSVVGRVIAEHEDADVYCWIQVRHG